MNDSINTGIGSFNVGLQNLIDPPLGTIVQGPAKINDTLAASRVEGNQYEFSNPESPKLVAPTIDADPQGMTTLTLVLKNYLGDLAAMTDKIPSPDTKFLEDAEEQILNLSDEQINALQLGIPNDQVVKMVRYAVFNPNADMPQAVKELAQQIRENTIASTGQEPTLFMATLTDKAAELGYNALFQEELSKMGLSKEDQQKLNAANEMPEFVSKLSPEMQKKLSAAQQKALAGVRADLGVPESWPIPRSPEVYAKKVGDALEVSIGDKLYDKLMDGQISKSSYNDLRTLLYIPGASPPNAAALKAILASIQSEAKAEVQAEWGFPNDYQPTINPHDYNAILTGTFYNVAKKAITSLKPALATESQALLIKALGNPATRETLSPELKQILSTIEGATQAKVSKLYSLPADWKPDVEMLASADKLDTSKLRLAQAALDFGVEFLSSLQALVQLTNINTKTQRTPAEGPTTSNIGTSSFGNKLLNYLKSVSAALTSLQEVLFVSSITDADLSKMTSRIERDASVGKLAKQKKELEEVKAKQAKMASMGPFKVIFMIILTIILTLTMGPAGFILAMGLIANSAAQSKGNVNKMDVFADFGKTMSQLATVTGNASFAKVFSALATIALIMVAPMCLITDLMFGEASSLKTILIGFGVPKDVAGYIAMAVQVVFIIVTIVVMIVIAPEAAFAELSALVSTISEKVASIVPKVVINVCNAIINALERFQSSNTVLSKIIEAVVDAAKWIRNRWLSDYTDVAAAAKHADAASAAFNAAEQQVTTCTQKLQSLKNAGASLKDISAAESALTQARAGEEVAKRTLTTAKEQLQRITQLKDGIDAATNNVQAAVDNLHHLKTQNASKASIDAAKSTLQDAQSALIKLQTEAINSHVKVATKALVTSSQYFDLCEDAFKTAENNVKSLTKQLKAVKLEQAGLQGTKLDEANALIAQLESKLTVAKDAELYAKTILSGADQEIQSAMNIALAPIGKLQGVTEMIMGIAQGSVQINNNILQAQLALIKGALDAFIVEVETFIKILKQMVAKLLQSLQELGQVLVNLGSMMQESWSKQSQAMTNLSQAG